MTAIVFIGHLFGCWNAVVGFCGIAGLLKSTLHFDFTCCISLKPLFAFLLLIWEDRAVGLWISAVTVLLVQYCSSTWIAWIGDQCFAHWLLLSNQLGCVLLYDTVQYGVIQYSVYCIMFRVQYFAFGALLLYSVQCSGICYSTMCTVTCLSDQHLTSVCLSVCFLQIWRWGRSEGLELDPSFWGVIPGCQVDYLAGGCLLPGRYFLL